MAVIKIRNIVFKAPILPPILYKKNFWAGIPINANKSGSFVRYKIILLTYTQNNDNNFGYIDIIL